MKLAYSVEEYLGERKKFTEATDIKSNADATRLAPFVDEDGYTMFWVNWSKPLTHRDGKKNRPYFSHYSSIRGNKSGFKETLQQEIEEQQKLSESAEHKTARLLIARYLEELVAKGQRLNWSFIDRSNSIGLVTGDLLQCVEEIKCPYKYTAPSGHKFEFDIALLGRKFDKERIILGALEVEKTHKTTIIKSLISRSLSFPLIKINIDDLTAAQINEAWAKAIISETTQNSEDGFRKNYILLNHSTLTVYCNIPPQERQFNDKHEYIILATAPYFKAIHNNLKALQKKLGLVYDDIHIKAVDVNENSNDPSIKNDVSLIRGNWREINEEEYMKVTLRLPSRNNSNLYLFHIAMLRLLNGHYDTYIGYKPHFCSRNINGDDFWTNSKGDLIIKKDVSTRTKLIVDFLETQGLV